MSAPAPGPGPTMVSVAIADLPSPEVPAPGPPGPAHLSCGWALVGCGWIGRDHVAPALREAEAARPVTVWDLDRAAAERVAEQLPGARVATDLADAVGDPGVQAVYVATPGAAHLQGVLAAAAARRAVLVEKPLAGDLADAEALVGACDGLVAGTALQQRWHPGHLALADALDSGAVGEVTAVRIAYGCWLPAGRRPAGAAPDEDNGLTPPLVAGGGAGLDLAPDGVDLVGMLLGDDLVRLTAQRSTRVHDSAVDDGAVLAGVTRRGVLFSSHVSYCTPEELPRRRLEVLGTRGQLCAVDTMGHTAGGMVLHTRLDGIDVPVAYDTVTSPVSEQLQRFSLAAVGASPWGYHLLRDLRLHRLLLGALA